MHANSLLRKFLRSNLKRFPFISHYPECCHFHLTKAKTANVAIILGSRVTSCPIAVKAEEADISEGKPFLLHIASK